MGMGKALGGDRRGVPSRVRLACHVAVLIGDQHGPSPKKHIYECTARIVGLVVWIPMCLAFVWGVVGWALVCSINRSGE